MFTDAQLAAEYAVAGNATLTLRSTRTNTRYTYLVKAPMDKETGKRKPGNMLFVGLLTGPDNESDYTYLGVLRNDEFVITKASKMREDSEPVKAFRYFIKKVFMEHEIPEQLEVFHDGTCGRCGRKLTVPESVESGIGPECAKKEGIYTKRTEVL